MPSAPALTVEHCTRTSCSHLGLRMISAGPVLHQSHACPHQSSGWRKWQPTVVLENQLGGLVAALRGHTLPLYHLGNLDATRPVWPVPPLPSVLDSGTHLIAGIPHQVLQPKHGPQTALPTALTHFLMSSRALLLWLGTH